tara:strand:+ start:99 stop:458 length:360 start_codon:yes stop_codon:yes gene_type:complete
MAVSILKDNSSMRVEKHTLGSGAFSTEALHLQDAKTIYFNADGAVQFWIPIFDEEATSGGGIKKDGTNAVQMDIPTSESVFAPTASKAGVIAEGHMPLFLLLKDGSGSSNVVYVYIIKR